MTPPVLTTEEQAADSSAIVDPAVESAESITEDPDLLIDDDIEGDEAETPASPLQSPLVAVRLFVTRFKWAFIVVPLICVALPIGLWSYRQVNFVTTKNAAVRGHLSEIGARLDGIVASVTVEGGDRVEAGQVLATLYDRHLLADVAEARAELASLKQTIALEQVALELKQSEILRLELDAEAQIATAQAKAEAAKYEAEAARVKSEALESVEAVGAAASRIEVRSAQAEAEGAKALFEGAKADVVVATRSAEHSVRLARDDVTIRKQQIGVLEANLEAAQARLLRAEADVAGASILAPEDGAIVRRLIQPGASVKIGQPMISIWLGETTWVEAWIDETDIDFIAIGSKATVTLRAYPGRSFVGTVEKIGLATDLEIPDFDVPQPRNSRMSGAPVVSIRVRLLDPPENLVPGLSAVVAVRK